MKILPRNRRASEGVRPAVLHMRDTPRARRAWLRSSFKVSAKFLREAGKHGSAEMLETAAAALMPKRDPALDAGPVADPVESFDDVFGRDDDDIVVDFEKR